MFEEKWLCVESDKPCYNKKACVIESNTRPRICPQDNSAKIKVVEVD